MLKLLRLNIGRYLLISCAAGIIDVFTANMLYKSAGLNYLSACNTGIVSGFIFQTSACTKYVFKNKNFINSLMIYTLTFFLGVVLADGTMLAAFKLLHLPFFISKAFSMAVPFFITYFIRRIFLGVKTLKEVL